jgi:hypothetical protein
VTRYVIGPDVALRLARDQAVVRGEHQLLAPAVLRSQLLSLLYQAVHRGEMTKKVADRLGWPDTLDAEYVALTQLQAAAFITLDPRLATAAADLVPVAPLEALVTAAAMP